MSGRTARLICKYRPVAPILCATADEQTGAAARGGAQTAGVDTGRGEGLGGIYLLHLEDGK